MNHTFPALRPRVNPNRPSKNTTGAITRIMDGLFGNGAPMLPDVENIPGGYSYHEGDLFTPGAMNYVFEPNTELPLMTIWGFGLLYPSGNFDPRQPAPPVSQNTIVNNGVGGLVAGTMVLQPLSMQGNEQGGS